MLLKDSFTADVQAVSKALAAARRLAEQAALPRVARVRLLLIVEEILANTVTHGQPPLDSLIGLRIEIRNDHVRIQVQDAGAPFDPRRDIPVTSRDSAVEAGVEGGAGWPMILEWCAIESYERAEGLNRLGLTLPVSDSTSNR